MLRSHCTVEEGVLIYAVRYALGRQTYAVGDVTRAVSANLPVLSNNTKTVLLRDINDHLSGSDRNRPAGDQIDGRLWRNLRDELFNTTE